MFGFSMNFRTRRLEYMVDSFIEMVAPSLSRMNTVLPANSRAEKSLAWAFSFVMIVAPLVGPGHGLPRLDCDGIV